MTLFILISFLIQIPLVMALDNIFPNLKQEQQCQTLNSEEAYNLYLELGGVTEDMKEELEPIRKKLGVQAFNYTFNLKPDYILRWECLCDDCGIPFNISFFQ